MDAKRFNEVLEWQLDEAKRVLGMKAGEYASSKDRLHNFRVAADLQGCLPQEALGGMMAKHTVSVYDMIYGDKPYSKAQWDEKIGDHINYLILLQAIVTDARESKIDKIGPTIPPQA